MPRKRKQPTESSDEQPTSATSARNEPQGPPSESQAASSDSSGKIEEVGISVEQPKAPEGAGFSIKDLINLDVDSEPPEKRKRGRPPKMEVKLSAKDIGEMLFIPAVTFLVGWKLPEDIRPSSEMVERFCMPAARIANRHFPTGKLSPDAFDGFMMIVVFIEWLWIVIPVLQRHAEEQKQKEAAAKQAEESSHAESPSEDTGKPTIRPAGLQAGGSITIE